MFAIDQQNDLDNSTIITVQFGRMSLIYFFFVWKLLGKINMKNATTFVRTRSGDHFGDAKMSKKDLAASSLMNCDRQKRFSHNLAIERPVVLPVGQRCTFLSCR